EHIARRVEEHDVALDERGMGAPEGEHAPVMGEDRARIAGLAVDRLGDVIRRHGQPGPGFAEAAVRRVRLPHYRRAAAVAALVLGPELDAVRIDEVGELKLGFGEPQLLALIEADGAAERQKDAGAELRQPGRVQSGDAGPARNVPDNVMIGEGPARPAVADDRLEGGDALAEMRGAERVTEEVEGVAHVDLVAARRVGG